MSQSIADDDSGRTIRFSALLLSLVATMAIAPFFSDEAEGITGLSILYSVVMIVGIYSVSHSYKLVLIGLAILVPALASEWISNFYATTPLVVTNMVLDGLLIIYVAGLILHEILLEQRVTVDTIAGGIAIFLLLGVGWVTVYAAIEYLHPGAFLVHGLPLYEIHHEIQVRYNELLYFSFVTLTTLGFGDIAPMTPFARFATTLEATVGQLYVAVFVARLVGLHLAEQRFDVDRSEG